METGLVQGDNAELESMKGLHVKAARLEARNKELEAEMEAKVIYPL